MGAMAGDAPLGRVFELEDWATLAALGEAVCDMERSDRYVGFRSREGVLWALPGFSVAEDMVGACRNGSRREVRLAKS